MRRDGIVHFSTAADFLESYSAFLTQGCLYAISERALTPFEELDLRLLVPAVGASIEVRGTVAALTEGRALIRLAAFGDDVRRNLELAARACERSTQPASSPAVSPSAASTDGHAGAAAARPPARPSVPPTRETAPQLRPSAPPTRETAPQLRPSAPPIRDTAAPMRPSAPPIRDTAAPMRPSAPPTREPAPQGRPSAPPSREPAPTMRPAEAVGRLSDPGARRSEPQVRPSGLPSRLSSIALAGNFENPTTPVGFLALPLVHPPTREQLEAPCGPLLVRRASALEAPCVCLRAQSQGHDLSFFLESGTTFVSPIPAETTLKALAAPEGRYEITGRPDVPGLRYKTDVDAVVVGIVRELVKRLREEDMSDGMAYRHGRSPRLSARGQAILKRLKLSSPQARVAGRQLDGTHVLDDVLHCGIGLGSVWRMIYLLEVTGGLEWGDAPPRQDLERDAIVAMLARIGTSDHFTAMGVHFSSHPREIELAYQRLRETFGPGTPARTTAPAVAEAIWRRVEQAHAVVGSSASRKTYRAQAFRGSQMDAVAGTLRDQALLADMRGQRAQAIALLEAATELYPPMGEELGRLRSAK